MPNSNLPKLTVFSALLTFATFLIAAITLNDGVFDYPLDDVFIHLAMAEQIANGGYGVNAGHYASAASSPIYPILLTPFAGTWTQYWMPIGWNILAVACSAGLLGYAIKEAELGKFGPWVAFLAPFSLAMHVSTYSGMENMGHTAASLAILIGLWTFQGNGRITSLLVAGVLFAPAFRLEGLALSMAAAGVVVLLGNIRAGIALGALAALPIVIFSVFLVSLGLEPLPSSIAAKFPVSASDGDGVLRSIGANIAANLQTYGGRYLFFLTVLVWVFAMSLARNDRPKALVGLAVGCAAYAHLAFAATGWLDRYENYLIVTLFAALALMLASSSILTKSVTLGATLLAGILTYAPMIPTNLNNMRAIHLQQGEMARFAMDFVDAPIAVNDLGYVSWRNPNYVLDLWGLGSREALEARVGGAPDGWADTFAKQHNVKLAMIYDIHIASALGPDWTKLGALQLRIGGRFLLGGSEVSFYARDAKDVPKLNKVLQEWSQGLPEQARFVVADGVSQQR